MVKITCFGEVLWDVFPTKKMIGGAPLNVANRLQSLGNQVSMVTAIGNDDDGKQILDFIKQTGMESHAVQIHENYQTGSVKVMLNDKGSATYDIEYPRAWDKIELTAINANLVKNADAFVFGSLVARDSTSKNTLYNLIELATFNIFDLNLRPPYYSKEVLIHLMNKADFIKFNDDELYEVSKMLGSKYLSLEQNLNFIAETTNTKQICVTKGSHGAVLLYHDKLYYNSGYLIDVVDTVGAGDSFLGSLIHKLLNKAQPQQAIDFACAVGAMVAQREGANPVLSTLEIESFINPY